MVTPCLHHVLVATRDLEKSRRFYSEVLELREIDRPAFQFPGAWYQFGAGQHLHLIADEGKTLRRSTRIDPMDVHFALGMRSYARTLAWLKAKGYREDVADDDLMKVVVRPNSIVGRPQIYIMDPDRNMIEFICEALD